MLAEEDDAYMHGTIIGVFIPDDDLGTEQETQVQGYDIDWEPLFGKYAKGKKESQRTST
jgi:hypothetical protein